MRISTSLPDGKWREVAEAARAFEELGFDEAAAHEVQHDSFATLVPATLSTHKIGLTTSVAIAFPRSPMIVAILAQDLNVNSNGRFVLGLGSQVKQHNERRFSTPWTPPAPRMGGAGGLAHDRCVCAGSRLHRATRGQANSQPVLREKARIALKRVRRPLSESAGASVQAEPMPYSPAPHRRGLSSRCQNPC